LAKAKNTAQALFEGGQKGIKFVRQVATFEP